ncbi:hypothetical protein GGX14DRAFT_560987 [Mycena pura]|uniref:D-isomer specific 2-hydroxyacid dehydrogenase NAD-binding domain-containing protein n=1 Tax=Mycena pura TaxID=153505 RepID=A0AAD6VP85_9AGAR|nr:hypothetical protein GGX14DRAFT_560987 [Mycena pura]
MLSQLLARKPGYLHTLRELGTTSWCKRARECTGCPALVCPLAGLFLLLPPTYDSCCPPLPACYSPPAAMIPLTCPARYHLTPATRACCPLSAICALPCCPPPAAAHCLLSAACCPLPPAPAACAHAAAPPLTCRPAICLPAAPLSTTRVQLPTPVAAASRPRQRSTSRSFPGSLEDRKSEGKLLLSLCKCAAKRAAKEVEGWIWGAGLDVVEEEPQVGPEHPLVREPRCVVLPHIGSAPLETRADS